MARGAKVLNFTVKVKRFDGELIHMRLSDFGFRDVNKYGAVRGLWHGMSSGLVKFM